MLTAPQISGKDLPVAEMRGPDRTSAGMSRATWHQAAIGKKRGPAEASPKSKSSSCLPLFPRQRVGVFTCCPASTGRQATAVRTNNVRVAVPGADVGHDRNRPRAAAVGIHGHGPSPLHDQVRGRSLSSPPAPSYRRSSTGDPCRMAGGPY